MEYVRRLSKLSKKDISVAGGKGANLGEMTKAGMPVPPGFVVTTSAYSDAIKTNRLKKNIAGLESIDMQKYERVDKYARSLRKKITNITLPDGMKDDILKAYREMYGNPVAVRSSATAEDSKFASFAGQQSTFLNIKNERQLLLAIKKCWASLFNTNAIYYRESFRLGNTKVKIAVVVQKLIESKKSGVMFTINPVTKKDEIVIEAALGLGELVVNGSITPDMYITEKFIVDKKGNRVIKEIHVNTQKWALYDKSSKLVKVKLSKRDSERQVLSKEEIKILIEFGEKIEKHYGFPQDIEWGINDKIYILQVRPITNLK